MVRAVSLLWVLVGALLITGVSFFYEREAGRHGFPFSFTNEQVDVSGILRLHVNYWSVLLDILVWWLLFSIVWMIIRNYVLELD